MFFTKNPAHWKINNFFREYLAQYGCDQNKKMQILRVLKKSRMMRVQDIYFCLHLSEKCRMVDLIDHGLFTLRAKDIFSVFPVYFLVVMVSLHIPVQMDLMIGRTLLFGYRNTKIHVIMKNVF